MAGGESFEELQKKVSGLVSFLTDHRAANQQSAAGYLGGQDHNRGGVIGDRGQHFADPGHANRGYGSGSGAGWGSSDRGYQSGGYGRDRNQEPHADRSYDTGHGGKGGERSHDTGHGSKGGDRSYDTGHGGKGGDRSYGKDHRYDRDRSRSRDRDYGRDRGADQRGHERDHRYAGDRGLDRGRGRGSRDRGGGREHGGRGRSRGSRDRGHGREHGRSSRDRGKGGERGGDRGRDRGRSRDRGRAGDDGPIGSSGNAGYRGSSDRYGRHDRERGGQRSERGHSPPRSRRSRSRGPRSRSRGPRSRSRGRGRPCSRHRSRSRSGRGGHRGHAPAGRSGYDGGDRERQRRDNAPGDGRPGRWEGASGDRRQGWWDSASGDGRQSNWDSAAGDASNQQSRWDQRGASQGQAQQGSQAASGQMETRVDVVGPDRENHYRAVHERIFGASRAAIVLGPRRRDHSKAIEDSEQLRVNYVLHGNQALLDAAAAAEAQAAEELRLQGVLSLGNAQATVAGMRGWELEGEGRHTRAFCHFDCTSGTGKIVNLAGPWRPSRTQAEVDAIAVRDAFRKGGLSAAQGIAAGIGGDPSAQSNNPPNSSGEDPQSVANAPQGEMRPSPRAPVSKAPPASDGPKPVGLQPAFPSTILQPSSAPRQTLWDALSPKVPLPKVPVPKAPPGNLATPEPSAPVYKPPTPKTMGARPPVASSSQDTNSAEQPLAGSRDGDSSYEQQNPAAPPEAESSSPIAQDTARALAVPKRRATEGARPKAALTFRRKRTMAPVPKSGRVSRPSARADVGREDSSWKSRDTQEAKPRDRRLGNVGRFARQARRPEPSQRKESTTRERKDFKDTRRNENNPGWNERESWKWKDKYNSDSTESKWDNTYGNPSDTRRTEQSDAAHNQGSRDWGSDSAKKETEWSGHERWNWNDRYNADKSGANWDRDYSKNAVDAKEAQHSKDWRSDNAKEEGGTAPWAVGRARPSKAGDAPPWRARPSERSSADNSEPIGGSRGAPKPRARAPARAPTRAPARPAPSRPVFRGAPIGGRNGAGGSSSQRVPKPRLGKRPSTAKKPGPPLPPPAMPVGEVVPQQRLETKSDAPVASTSPAPPKAGAEHPERFKGTRATARASRPAPGPSSVPTQSQKAQDGDQDNASAPAGKGSEENYDEIGSVWDLL